MTITFDISTDATGALDREMLESSWYTDPEVFRREQSNIFQKQWLYVAHVDELQKPGDFVARTLAGVPVFVTRATDGELRAFLNICRHRLHQVAEGCGNSRHFRCKYHGWTYDDTGALVGAPRSNNEPDFDASGLGLRQLSAETWGPLVFINLGEPANSLEQTLDRLPGLAAARGLNFDLVRRCRQEWTIPCNWKVIVENAMECYHCPLVHPGFSNVFDVTSNSHQVDYLPYGSAHASPLRADRDVVRKEGEPLPFHAYYLWPNLWISARSNESYFTLVYDPVDESNTRVMADYYFAPDVSDEHVTDRVTEARIVIDQDTDVCLSVQASHRAGIGRTGQFILNSEETLARFDQMVRASLQ